MEKIIVTVFGIVLAMIGLAIGGYVCWRWGYQQAAQEAWDLRTCKRERDRLGLYEDPL
jgi:hypothetical protein